VGANSVIFPPLSINILTGTKVAHPLETKFNAVTENTLVNKGLLPVGREAIID
jgi:hypothetical protein